MVLLFASWRYACRAGLIKEGTSSEIYRAMRRRILGGQALYALGALLCLINTYWSIGGFIVLANSTSPSRPGFGSFRVFERPIFKLLPSEIRTIFIPFMLKIIGIELALNFFRSRGPERLTRGKRTF